MFLRYVTASPPRGSSAASATAASAFQATLTFLLKFLTFLASADNEQDKPGNHEFQVYCKGSLKYTALAGMGMNTPTWNAIVIGITCCSLVK